eukprot:855195-Amphidinium_carterae.1
MLVVLIVLIVPIIARRVGPPDYLFAWRAHAAKVLNIWGMVGNVLSELTRDAHRPAATGVENPPEEPDNRPWVRAVGPHAK